MTALARRADGRRVSRVLVFGAALLLLALGVWASLALGAFELPFAQVLELLLRPQDSSGGLVVWTLRMPRTVVAALAGAALAVAGALLQGVTRNPLADPGILGVEAGAALALLVAVVFFPGLPAWAFVPCAFLGGRSRRPSRMLWRAGWV